MKKSIHDQYLNDLKKKVAETPRGKKRELLENQIAEVVEEVKKFARLCEKKTKHKNYCREDSD